MSSPRPIRRTSWGRCAAPRPGEGKFTGLAVEVDAGNRIFTTLPVVPVEERMLRNSRMA